MAVLKNQGRPRQTKISKTLEPIAFDTAMSPYLSQNLHEYRIKKYKKTVYPSLITAILERASGTETPAATKVSPITVSGTPIV